MYRHILVTTDGSGLSGRAVDAALGLAKLAGADITVLHVVPRYPMSYFEGGSNVSADEVARIEKQWSDEGQATVDAARDKAAKACVSANGAIAHSDLVAEAILAAAVKHGADLIVMASHGRKGLKRLLLGSETQHVLTHSTVPVLVIR